MFQLPFFGLLLALGAYAQSSSLILAGTRTTSMSSNLAPTSIVATSIPNLGGDLIPTGSAATYIMYTSTVTESTALASPATGSQLAGSTSIPLPNNQACNGYTEFCSRSYSNITFVAAHNSPFDVPNDLASNQDFGVITQLNDGIRMLQGQTHMLNGVVNFCHTSCDLLNAGPAEVYFSNVTTWLAANPYEVVTILIGNGDFVDVSNFVSSIESSGLSKYAYIPPVIPMALNDWPTLATLIQANTRAIIFMDYDADQTKVPYILDEFSQLWESPFSPTDASFPCTVERPPGITSGQALTRMYMANHNLNTNISLLGLDILVPDIINLPETNSLSGFGSLGLAANNCVNMWGRPPNFLLVDYYNVGNGSVFEVAAKANGVTYIPMADTSSAGSVKVSTGLLVLVLSLGFAAGMI